MRSAPANQPMQSALQTLVATVPVERVRRPSGRSERSLIRGAQAGSQSDMELLFRRHWPRAYRAAFLIVHDHAAAEDIAQEAFLAAIRRLDRFDRRRPFAPWLGAIVANRAIDWARARAARRETSDSGFEPTAAAEVPLGPYSEDVLAALASLSPEHRPVVVM